MYQVLGPKHLQQQAVQRELGVLGRRWMLGVGHGGLAAAAAGQRHSDATALALAGEGDRGG